MPLTRPFRLALAALLLAAAPAAAQQPAPPQIPDSVRAVLQEIQEVQSRLAAIQARAMEDAELQRQQEVATLALRDAMLEMHPELVQQIARLDALRTEAIAAQQAQDAARMEAVTAEAIGIQQNIETAQEEAATRPDVAAKIDTFRDGLIARMRTIDPETDALIARMEELGRRLEAMQL